MDLSGPAIGTFRTCLTHNAPNFPNQFNAPSVRFLARALRCPFHGTGRRASDRSDLEGEGHPPQQLGAPGVYIEEIPSGRRVIRSVATSIGAFVDFFREGPMNEPVQVFGVGDFGASSAHRIRGRRRASPSRNSS